MSFKFDLGDEVYITLSNTKAKVIGRADYLNGTPNTYWLYYVDSNGDANKSWFDEQDVGLLKQID